MLSDNATQDTTPLGLVEGWTLHINGQTVRHYALTSDQEYFAECSEAFFGTNDMYPFVRAELHQHDPAAFETLTKVWNLKP